MELAVTQREHLGKAVGALRKQGLIPAELYGHGVPNLHLTVDAKEFGKVFKEAGEHTVVNLLVGGERRPTVVHDIKRNYVDGSIEHIDFYQVRMDEKLRARIPVAFIGEAPATKELGGILNRTMSEIEVESLPGDLPHQFTVDLSPLVALNQSIHVKDLDAPKGVRVLVDPGTVIVTVTPPVKEEVAEKPVEVTEVKVETEEKKAERQKEKTSAAAETQSNP